MPLRAAQTSLQPQPRLKSRPQAINEPQPKPRAGQPVNERTIQDPDSEPGLDPESDPVLTRGRICADGRAEDTEPCSDKVMGTSGRGCSNENRVEHKPEGQIQLELLGGLHIDRNQGRVTSKTD